MSRDNHDIQKNTLGLTQNELSAFLDQHEKTLASSEAPDREYVRWNFRTRLVQLQLHQSAGQKITLPVATRNISRNGICILHSAYIHKGTDCSVLIKTDGNDPQLVPGTVKRCNHISGRIHEVGIQFDHMISTKDLLGLDPLHEAYSLERVDPTRLHGSVLIVSNSDLDRDLLLMYLEDTNLAINTADTIENAVARAKKRTDLIITDYHLGEHTAPQLMESLRKEECDLSIVVLTSDKSEPTLDTIRQCGACGILSKPTSKDRLLQALAEFLHADGDGGPLYSFLTNQDPAFPLLAKFLSEVPRMALNLEKALRENNKQECMNIIRTLSGTSGPLGFPEISNLTIAAEKSLASSTPKSIAPHIRALIVACRRIKAKPAA
jgi:CheY-like chemotaxis protein